ncbi:MAG: hypothetical protein ACKN9T_02655 [Candidatus Methylumidiphilus sp.]
MKKHYGFWLSRLAVLACMTIQNPATAATFWVSYSGAEFLNSAEAHGSLTVDDALFAGASMWAVLEPGVQVTAFTLTVSGASAGNGTFQLEDFAMFSWKTAGAALDPTSELVGQWTAGGPWGSSRDPAGDTGDFNLVALSETAPNWVLPFQMATNGGTGDPLALVSIRPVPLPATVWLLGSALAALGLSFRRGSIRT